MSDFEQTKSYEISDINFSSEQDALKKLQKQVPQNPEQKEQLTEKTYQCETMEEYNILIDIYNKVKIHKASQSKMILFCETALNNSGNGNLDNFLSLDMRFYGSIKYNNTNNTLIQSNTNKKIQVLKLDLDPDLDFDIRTDEIINYIYKTLSPRSVIYNTLLKDRDNFLNKLGKILSAKVINRYQIGNTSFPIYKIDFPKPLLPLFEVVRRQQELVENGYSIKQDNIRGPESQKARETMARDRQTKMKKNGFYKNGKIDGDRGKVSQTEREKYLKYLESKSQSQNNIEQTTQAITNPQNKETTTTTESSENSAEIGKRMPEVSTDITDPNNPIHVDKSLNNTIIDHTTYLAARQYILDHLDDNTGSRKRFRDNKCKIKNNQIILDSEK